MDLVIERLLSEERKMKERVASGIGAGRKDNALIANRGKIYTSAKKVCFHCGKPGHFKRSCPLMFGSSNQDGKKSGRTEEKYKKEKANNAELKNIETESSESENDALVAGYALSASTASNWIIDSGATSHMCNDNNQFITIKMLKKPLLITLGDGRALEAIDQGVISNTNEIAKWNDSHH